MCYVNANELSYDLKHIHTNEITRAHHIQLKPWREPPGYLVDHLRKFPLSVNEIEDKLSEVSEAVGGFIGSCMYTRNPILDRSKDHGEKSKSHLIVEGFGCNHSEGKETTTDECDSGVPDKNVSYPLEKENLSVLLDDLCVPFPNVELLTPLSLSSGHLLDAPVPSLGLQAPMNVSSFVDNEVLQQSYVVIITDAEKENDWSVSSVHGVNTESQNEFAFNSGSLTELLDISVGIQSTIEDYRKFESFITHVEEVVTLSEIVISLDEIETNSHDKTEVDVPNNMSENSLIIHSNSEDEILIDIGKLFVTLGETSVHNFSGFSSPISRRCELRLRLDEIRKEIQDMRASVLENRRASLDRIQKLNQHRFDEEVSEMFSPPFTRSRGRALDLPLVQNKILEYNLP